ncbi:hypothetical protein HYX19_03510 [Candidatus Woesearchaeota archaeon]|nr:hypothetical protein [Candidatus Woesearchaeota archaeon]
MPDIIAIVRDVFFAAKIKETANQLNLSVLFIYDNKELQEVKDKPKLIIFDLNSNLIENFNLIKEFNVRTICYLSHTQIDLREKALEYGFNEIMPKSKFSFELPNILKSLQNNQ